MALQACVITHLSFSALRHRAFRAGGIFLALVLLVFFPACQSSPFAQTPPIDPMQVRLTGMENAAMKSRSNYLAAVAQQQKEEAALEAAMPKPDLTQGSDVISEPGNSH